MNSTRCFRSFPLKPRYTSGEDDPLHDFYIPVLRVARHYDRAVGFFSSNAFVVAAQGIAHLIAHGGTMRLLVGAQLSLEDAEAIFRGEKRAEEALSAALERFLPDPESLADRIVRQRLEALAWMIARGHLAIQVVLPAESNYPGAYFHIKTGVLTDACGNTVAFHGSINETATAWQANYEDFSVFCSWKPGEQGRVEDFRQEFERIWNNEHSRWHAYPVPEAIRRRLLRYTPDTPPLLDPLERTSKFPQTAESTEEYRISSVAHWVARFLREAPFFPNATALGQVTAAVEPWPHQTFVLQHILERYPQRFLIADEVGLGKTIEAGLVLRQLRLMGLAQRVLIMAPKSVLRQWQEELYEKFNLSVPIYDGRDYLTWDGNRVAAPRGVAAWDTEPWLLASAQLARRSDRSEELLQARRWDVVVVDEAHHARRRDFLDLKRYRPNQLLALLQRLALRTEFMLLLTATPMQVHPIEVWDLLSLLGLSGRWAVEHGKAFLAYFEALDKRPVRWGNILPLIHDELLATDNENFNDLFPNLSAPQRQRLQRLLTTNEPDRAWQRLSQRQRENLQTILLSLARRHTPLHRLVLRHTRSLLRRYRKEGLLQATVPWRRPWPRWIPMTAEEADLYRAVSDYIATFYRRYEESRRGLGFVLTVYRRRLTSSLYALRTSLERRLDALQRRQRLLGPEDEVSAERIFLEEDLASYIPNVKSLPESLRLEEIRALETLVGQMQNIGDYDSKSTQLLEDLAEVLKKRDKVLIFTQYTDTVDYLRERLKVVYGTALACYSGRGGERWNGQRWQQVSKEEVKNAFASGEVRILLATDAASEGLNLQTCGVLINYDMPWNPMRVEQRIGRIDRIGQVYDEVWIYHYFYEDTIEEKVYRRLGERIGFFEQVVGPLQPILTRVEDILQRVAVLPVDEQAAQLKQELDKAEREATTTSFNLDEWVGGLDHMLQSAEPPWVPEVLDTWVKSDPTLQRSLHLEKDGIYRLEVEDGSVVLATFLPEVFDAHPDTVHLLTYGSPYWDAWLRSLGVQEQPATGELDDEQRILILHAEGPPPTTVWYVLTPDHKPQRVQTMDVLQQVLRDWDLLPTWDEEALRAARSDFEQALTKRVQRLKVNREKNSRLHRSALLARGRSLLRETMALALVQGRALRKPLFENGLAPTTEGVWQLIQEWGEPFAKLAAELGNLLPKEYQPLPSEQDAYYRRYYEMRPEGLRLARQRLQREVQAWLDEWKGVKQL